MEDIFLSYSSKDAERIQLLRDALTGHGFSVFWDHDVPPGTDWDTWIRQRLAQSRCAVVAWTFQSVESKNVRHEAVIAQNQNKLLSVMLDPVPAERFPMGQYTIEAVNLSSWSGDPKAKEYLDLLRWLESRLTPTWISNALEARDLAVSSERSRREAAESQVRLLRDQVARDAVERQTLEQERDAARTELATTQSAAKQLQPKSSGIRRLLPYGSVVVLCAMTGLAGYQLALGEPASQPPVASDTTNPPPPPVETAPAAEPAELTPEQEEKARKQARLDFGAMEDKYINDPRAQWAASANASSSYGGDKPQESNLPKHAIGPIETIGPLRTRARSGAHVVWDALTRPRARTRDDVPWSAEAITPEWLTAVMGAAHPGAAATQVAVGDGHQGSSVRRQLRVQWNELGAQAKLPASLFAKTTPTLLTRLSSGMAAAGEGRFFRELRGELAIEAPVLLHSAYDRASGRSIHVFEDLVASRSATFCDHRTAISRARAEQIVDTLAALHGHFHASPRFDAELRWLTNYEAFFRTGASNGIREGHDRAMVEAADVIPPTLLARKSEIWPAALRALALHEREPRTLLHSDVHLGNWYVTGAGTMGLCDWALVCKGHWSRDVAYALMTTLTTADRRAWERELLERYLERMREQCGLTTSFEAAWQHYRLQAFAALLMWTPTLCHPATMPDMQPEAMSREMIARISAAIADLGALDVDPGA